jgi:F-type H+-transporting ATPase subunit delta
MVRGAAARRYAKALFELAKEAGQVAEVVGELTAIGDLLEGNPELHGVLFRPLHPVAQRRAVLDGVTERIGASPTVQSFFSLLIDQRRLVDFPAIREEVERLASEDAGLRRAEVVSSVPLRDDQLGRLRRALSTALVARWRFRFGSTRVCSAASSPRSATWSSTEVCERSCASCARI